LSDEVKTRVSIEGADQAVSDVTRLVETEKKRTDATRAATEETQKATKAAEQHSKAQKQQSDSTAELIAQWTSMLAVGSGVKSLLDDITKRARETVGAMKELAEVSRGLATNVGGKVADKLVNEINVIAAESGMDVAGRNALVEAMGTATDVRDMSEAEQVALARNLGKLDQATGLRGKAGFKPLQTITSRLGVTDEAAVDMLASMVNQGISGDMVQRIVQRGGDARFLGLVSQARGSMDTDDIGRQFDSITNAMMAVDEAGNIKPELEVLGLTNEMKPFDRLQFLTNELASGKINEGQLMQVTGGPQAAPLMNAFRQAMTQPGAVQAATSALTDPQAAKREIEKFRQSARQKNRETLNRAELRVQIAKENEGMSAYNMNTALIEKEFDAEGVPTVLRAVTELPAQIMTGFFADDESVNESDRANLVEIQKMSGKYIPPPTDNMSAGGRSVVNAFRQRRGQGFGAAGTVIINNYTNSILNGTDPTKAPAAVKQQD